MSRLVHCSLDIEGALGWPKRKLRGLIRDPLGRLLDEGEARAYLLGHLAAGRRVLPFGPKCDGFSFHTGCPGHEEAAS
jgi:hypothetical protein